MVSASLCLSGPAGSLPSPSIAPSARWVWRSISPGSTVSPDQSIAAGPSLSRHGATDAILPSTMRMRWSVRTVARCGSISGLRERRRFAADAALASKQRQRAGQDVPHRVPPFVARKPTHRDEVPQSTIAKVAKVDTPMRARTREGHRGGVDFVYFVRFRAKRSERSDYLRACVRGLSCNWSLIGSLGCHFSPLA